MFLSKSSLAALLLAGGAQAQYLINELSFGYDGRLSPNNDGKVPNFNLQGNPVTPEILSNRLVLTPVAPGNQRSSIWSDQTLRHDTWVADVDFRASGPERGGGNLNIWLAADPEAVGQSSIYTVSRFQGLAVVVDTYGGTGGMIRGFLNDGSVDFSTKPVLDNLVFGQCYYSYRNLGRPSQIKLRQMADNFRVEIDGKLCFESGKVQMPQGYKWGITAATPDNPDSFEVFKMVVMSEKLSSGGVPSGEGESVSGKSNSQSSGGKVKKQKTKKQKKQQQQQQEENVDEGGSNDGEEEGEPAQFFARDRRPPIPDDPLEIDIADSDPDTITGSRQQFADLHNRLQSLSHHSSTVYRSVAKHAQADEKRHGEVSKALAEIRGELRRLEGLSDLVARMEALEKETKALKNEVTSKARQSENKMRGYLSDHHNKIQGNIEASAPGHGRLIALIVLSQVVLVGVYGWYKRRNSDLPKKYV